MRLVQQQERALTFVHGHGLVGKGLGPNRTAMRRSCVAAGLSGPTANRNCLYGSVPATIKASAACRGGCGITKKKGDRLSTNVVASNAQL